MFETLSPIYCPSCPAEMSKSGRRLDVPLELNVRNYSGTGVDIARCVTCNKRFVISYVVGAITELHILFVVFVFAIVGVMPVG